jgi:hypothetical protein
VWADFSLLLDHRFAQSASWPKILKKQHRTPGYWPEQHGQEVALSRLSSGQVADYRCDWCEEKKIRTESTDHDQEKNAKSRIFHGSPSLFWLKISQATSLHRAKSYQSLKNRPFSTLKILSVFFSGWACKRRSSNIS